MLNLQLVKTLIMSEHQCNRSWVIGFVVCLLSLVFFQAAAVDAAAVDGYPNRALRIVVPYPAGGGTDAIARTMALKLSETIGQPVVIDNRSGANGIIGTDVVAKAKPDGYTALITLAIHAINPSLYAKLPYDSAKDFTPITLLAEYPYVITVHPSLPVRTVPELIRFAKVRPKALSYASSGNGSGPHLGMKLFEMSAGLQMVHVPYKGAATAMTDLIAGRVDLFFNNFLAAAPTIQSGRLRALAVTSAKRSNAMLSLPTVAEAGIPQFAVTGWYGLLMPAGVPQPIVTSLHESLVGTLRAPDVADKLAREAAVVVANNPQQFSVFMRAETERWAHVIQKSQLKIEAY